MKTILLSLLLFSGSANAIAVSKQFYVKQQSVVSVGTSSAKFLDQNINRVYLLLQNNGSSSVSIKLGSDISGSEGIVLVASGGSVEFGVGPTDSLYMKSASGTDSVVIIEGNAE